MKEKDIRSFHRNLGIILAFFIVIQAGSGLFITIDELSAPHSHSSEQTADQAETGHNQNVSTVQAFLSLIHHGGGVIAAWYRIFLCIGIVTMALSGAVIYLKIRARTRMTQKK